MSTFTTACPRCAVPVANPDRSEGLHCSMACAADRDFVQCLACGKDCKDGYCDDACFQADNSRTCLNCQAPSGNVEYCSAICVDAYHERESDRALMLAETGVLDAGLATWIPSEEFFQLEGKDLDDTLRGIDNQFPSHDLPVDIDLF